jgi:outer membrane biosynthesis protein TonB
VRKNLVSAVAGAALVLLIASGCQATPQDIAPDRAEAFQSRVLAVTTAVADGGFAAALESLTALQTELDAAAADGTLSFARHQRIEAAMDVVRADIQAAIEAQTVPAPEPEPEPEESTAPVEEEEATPAPETDAEKKAREAAEKAAEEEAKKAAEDKKKADEKAAEELKKAAEEAKKKAERDATSTPTPSIDDELEGDD